MGVRACVTIPFIMSGRLPAFPVWLAQLEATFDWTIPSNVKAGKNAGTIQFGYNRYSSRVCVCLYMLCVVCVCMCVCVFVCVCVCHSHNVMLLHIVLSRVVIDYLLTPLTLAFDAFVEHCADPEKMNDDDPDLHKQYRANVSRPPLFQTMLQDVCVFVCLCVNVMHCQARPVVRVRISIGEEPFACLVCSCVCVHMCGCMCMCVCVCACLWFHVTLHVCC